LSNKTIVVTGANGRQAQAAIKMLLAEGFKIRALVRDASKAKELLSNDQVEIFEGDLSKPDSLQYLFDAAYGMFMVLPYTHQAIEYGDTLLDLACKSDLEHIVYSSVGGADRYQKVDHFRDKKAIEDKLKATGISYTILRPAAYMDEFAHPKAIKFIIGMLRLYMSDQKRFQLIAIEDIGRFVAMAFKQRSQFENRELEIAGDDVTIEQLINKIRTIKQTRIKPFRMPRFFLYFMPGIAKQMFQFYADDGWQADLKYLRDINPDLLSFEDWLKSTDIYG